MITKTISQRDRFKDKLLGTYTEFLILIEQTMKDGRCNEKEYMSLLKMRNETYEEIEHLIDDVLKDKGE